VPGQFRECGRYRSIDIGPKAVNEPRIRANLSRLGDVTGAIVGKVVTARTTSIPRDRAGLPCGVFLDVSLSFTYPLMTTVLHGEEHTDAI
jgi:hypothetical protein